MNELSLATGNWHRRGRNSTSTVANRDMALAAPLIVTVLHDLESVRELWQLMQPHAVSTVFQTLDVFTAWVAHIAPSQSGSWFVVVVTDPRHEIPRLLLPLYHHTRDGLVIIEPFDLGVCDFNAPVIARDFEPTRMEMNTIWAAILKGLPTCDLIQLSKLPTHIGPQPNPLLLLDHVHPIKLSNYKTSLITHLGRWTPADLPMAVYEDVSRRRRKLDKRATIRLHTAQSTTQAEGMFTEMLVQRAARCEAMKRDNLLACPHYRAFYRALIQPDNPNTVGCMHALTADGDMIATGYSLLGNNALHMIFPTFKGERWRNYSPGMQLFVDTMSWASNQGLANYDFTIGDESFKAQMGADQHPLYEYLVALTPRGRPTVYRDRLRRYVRRNPKMLKMVTRWRQNMPFGKGSAS